jgi:hypothetical protein
MNGRPSVLTDADFERFRQIAREAAKEVITERDALLGINSQTFDGVKKFRDTINWAQDAMNNTETAKRWLWAGFATLFVAALKSIWTLYEGMVSWVAIHAK